MSPLADFFSSRKYKLFVSHDWEYADEYEGVLRLLNADVTFRWENLSVPIEKPIPSHPTLPRSHWTIMRDLLAKIERADCLLVLAGMYINYSGWIQSEIQLGQEFGKPIIAVKRWGQERVPEALQQVSICEPVCWGTGPIIAAIKKHALPIPASKPSFTLADQIAQVNESRRSSGAIPTSAPVNLLGTSVPPTSDSNLTNLLSLMSAENSSEIPASDSSSYWDMLAQSFEPTPSGISSAIPTSVPNESTSSISAYGNLQLLYEMLQSSDSKK